VSNIAARLGSRNETVKPRARSARQTSAANAASPPALLSTTISVGGAASMRVTLAGRR
jgi:hypothetical protein